MEALIGVVIGSIITGIITWTTTKQKTVTDLINVDKQIDSSYRQQRDQLEATARTTQQQIHAQVILAERMKWIGLLRESIAEYQGVLYELFILSSSSTQAGLPRNLAASSRAHILHYKIHLLLNPLEEDHQTLAADVSTAFHDAAKQNSENLGLLLSSIRTLAQKILKREWERVKAGK